MSSTPTHIADFYVLPLTIRGIPSFPQDTTHYVCIRPHSPSIPTPEDSRCLFLTNVPVDATTVHFRALFAGPALGGTRVERVDFEGSKPAKRNLTGQGTASQKSKKRKRLSQSELEPDLPGTWDREVHRSGSTAIVVFIDHANRDIAMKAVKKAAQSRREVLWPSEEVQDKVPPLGSARYKAHHMLQFPDSDRLQASVDAYMTAFGSAEQVRARAAALAGQVPDEDGFVTVTRGAKVGPAAMDTARSDELKARVEAKRKKEERKSEGLSDFYRFQNRERKKAQQGELVKRFEEDKRRVGMMRGRGGRNFKPE